MGCLTVTFERIGGIEAVFEKKSGGEAWFSMVCDTHVSKKRLRDKDGKLVLTNDGKTIILKEE